MKSYFFLALIICIVGCNTDKKLEAIEKHIANNGKSVNYSPISTENVKCVMVGTTLNNIFDYIVSSEITTIDSAHIMFDKIIEKGRKDKDADVVNVWSFNKSRLEKIQNLKTDDIDYCIVKHIFSIDNPLVKDATITVTSYFYFDGNDKLIGVIDEGSFKEFKRNAVSYPEEQYEQALFKIAYY